MHPLAASLLTLALFAAPNAERADCGNVADHYKAAVAKVIDALRAYETCIARSGERDDCAAQMQGLDDAHDAFASAVADAKDCR